MKVDRKDVEYVAQDKLTAAEGGWLDKDESDSNK